MNLRTIRERLCLSPEFFAHCLKIHPSTLEKLEAAKLDDLFPDIGDHIERRLQHLGWLDGQESRPRL